MSEIVKYLDGDLYFQVFISCFLVVLLVELWRPERTVTWVSGRRWLSNFALYFLNLFVLFIVFPLTSVAAAGFAQAGGIGLFNLWAAAPALLVFVFAWLVMDLANYAQHVLLHQVPLLWRIHRAHHTDVHCDVTTSLRFHPLEVVLSQAVDVAVILLCGAPPLVVACYQIFRITLSTLAHGNIGLSPPVEGFLRFFVVTPDFHRVHHSRDARESNSNYSGGFTWWDRLFGTYLKLPALGHANMAIGVAGYSESRASSIGRILIDPVNSEAGED